MTYEQIKEKYLNGEKLTNDEMGILIHGKGASIKSKGDSKPLQVYENIGIPMHDGEPVIFYRRTKTNEKR